MLAMLFVGIELSSPAAQHMRLSGLESSTLAGNFLDSFPTSSRELFQPRSDTLKWGILQVHLQ